MDVRVKEISLLPFWIQNLGGLKTPIYTITVQKDMTIVP